MREIGHSQLVSDSLDYSWLIGMSAHRLSGTPGLVLGGLFTTSCFPVV